MATGAEPPAAYAAVDSHTIDTAAEGGLMGNRLRTYALCCLAILTCGVLAACGSAVDTADSEPSSEPSTSPTSDRTTEPTPEPTTSPSEPQDDETQSADRSITIISTPWEETVAVSHLWQHVLGQNGYQVEVKEIADVAIAYPAMTAGDVDVFFGAWMPGQKTHLRDNRGSVEDLGPWFEHADTTIVVPNYVKAKTIDDLGKIRKRLDGSILGIEPGSQLSETVKDDVIPKYGLRDMKLRPTSTPALIAALERATTARKPIAATLWHPHWAYEELPIKDLADPKNALGKPSSIHTIVRQDLRSENRAIAKALDDFTMTDAQLESLMATIHRASGDRPAKAAARWAAKHKKFVNGMLKVDG